MAFPDDVIEKAFERADGKCECTLISCGHEGRLTFPPKTVPVAIGVPA